MSAARRFLDRASSRSNAARAASLLVAMAPLALGGATAETRLAIAIASVVALAMAVAARGSSRTPNGATAAAAAFVAYALVCTLQTLPLPCGLVDRIGGDGRGEFVSLVARVLATASPPACTISLDRGATLGATLVAFAMLAAFLVGVLVTSVTGSARSVVASVAVSAVAVAAVTFAHDALGAPRVYGLYEPRFDRYVLLGPLLNANHLAALACAGLLASLYFVFDRERPAQRLVAGGAAVVCATLAFASRSRGGIVGVGLALVFATSLLATRRRPWTRADRTLAGLVAAGFVATTALEFALEGEVVIADFVHSPVKTGLVAEALRLVPSAGLLGYGRGAFAAAFAPSSDRALRAMSPENLVATLGTELGAFVGGGMLLLLVVGLARRLRRGERDAARIAAAMALGLVVHDLADFALDFAGVGVSFAMLVGAAFANGGSRSPLESPVRRRVRGAPALVAFVGVLGFAWPATKLDLTRQLDAARRARARHDAQGVARELASALAAHPFEPAVFLELAYDAATRRDASVLTWANLAMQRAPSWTAPHSILAAYFAGLGRSAQSAAEIAAVAEADPVEGARFVCVSGARTIEAVRLARTLPFPGPALDTYVHELARCMPARARLAMLDEGLAIRPNDVQLARLAIELAIGVEGNDSAERRFAEATRIAPRDPELLLVGARLALHARDATRALARARAALAAGASGYAAQATLATAAAHAADEPTLARALARLERMVDDGELDAASLELTRAECESILGQDDAALASYERAYDAAPSVAAGTRVVDFARAHGRPVRAEAAQRRICRDFPEDALCTPRPTDDSRVP